MNFRTLVGNTVAVGGPTNKSGCLPTSARSPRRSVVDTYGLLCGPPRRYCPIFLLFLWLSTCHFAKAVNSHFSIAVPITCCFTYILVVFSNALKACWLSAALALSARLFHLPTVLEAKEYFRILKVKRSEKFEAKISEKREVKFYSEIVKHMWNGSKFALFRL
jgi:hypothetical protein